MKFNEFVTQGFRINRMKLTFKSLLFLMGNVWAIFFSSCAILILIVLIINQMSFVIIYNVRLFNYMIICSIVTCWNGCPPPCSTYDEVNKKNKSTACGTNALFLKFLHGNDDDIAITIAGIFLQNRQAKKKFNKNLIKTPRYRIVFLKANNYLTSLIAILHFQQ